jgi:hypothetical protein
VGRDHGLACGQPLQGVDQFPGGCRLEQIATRAHPQHLEQQAQVVCLGEDGHRERRLLDQHRI